MNSKKVLIVGGVAGGASAAARLRRLDENAEIILFEKGEHISFANCGLPYYIGDVINDKRRLLVQTPRGMNERFNVDVRVNSEVTAISPDKKEITVLDKTKNTTYTESYDKLVLSPGAEPIKPPIPGVESARVFTIRNIPDTYLIKDYVIHNKVGHAVVVGAGYVGIEMAENLMNLGIDVTMVELSDHVMGPLDYDMASIVHEHMKGKNVKFYLNDGLKEVHESNEGLAAELNSGKKISCDMIILSIGVKPEIKLAKEAGLKIGQRGGIEVNEYLQTSNPDIYAVGDAIEIVDFISSTKAIIPLAGPASKQGRIAADNICGANEKYKGTLGTSIIKVFDLTVAGTGNNEALLKRNNIEYLKTYIHASSHADYYPNAAPLSMKLLFTPKEGKILGCQIVGYEGVDKRIDVISTAIQANMTVFDLEELELSYAPPFSSAKDPVNLAGYTAANILRGDHKVIFWDEIADRDKEKSILLDVRTEREFNYGTIEDSVNISVDQLRERMNEIPKDKKIIIFCQVGRRGYVAYRILAQAGFEDVVNLSGGYRTYSVAREK